MRIRHGGIAMLSMPILLAGTACGLGIVGQEQTGPGTTQGIDGGAGVTPPVTTTDAGAPPPVTTCIQADGGTACAPWAACESGTCVDVAQALVAFRHELACGSRYLLTNYCDTSTGQPPDVTAVLTGTPGATYDLAVRIRGVLEQKTYAGATAFPATGTNATFLTRGGTANDDHWNVVDMRVASPDFAWHLNSGKSMNEYSDPLDYRTTITAAAGTSVSLDISSNDARMARGRDASNNEITLEGIPTFSGQFVRVDVEAVTRR